VPAVMRYTIMTLRTTAALALAILAGCSTMRARPSVDASRSSLAAVLCTDPNIDAPATWCHEPEPNRPWLGASSTGR
jgi:hypothetical protein